MKKQFLIYCILASSTMAFAARFSGDTPSAQTPASPTPTPASGTPTPSTPGNFASIEDVVNQATKLGKLNEVFQGALAALNYVDPKAATTAPWVVVGASLAKGTAANAIAIPAAGAANSSKRSLGRLGGKR